MISSVCGHAVYVHAGGKNAALAGSFRPTGSSLVQPAEAQFLCKISTMCQCGVFWWRCVGRGCLLHLGVAGILHCLTIFETSKQRLFSPSCLAWPPLAVHLPGLNLDVGSGRLSKVGLQLLTSSPPLAQCWSLSLMAANYTVSAHVFIISASE